VRARDQIETAMQLRAYKNPSPLKVKIIASLIEVAARLIGSLTRILVRNASVLRRVRERYGGYILAGWHGRMFLPICYFRGQDVHAVVSLSEDGEFAARVFQRWGWSPIRGSTTKGSVRVLLGATRALKAGHILGLTPDGPIGPARKVAAGGIHLAAVSGCPIVPVGVGMSKFLRFRSWDRFSLPVPLSTGVLSFGEPVCVPRDMPEEKIQTIQRELEASINLLEEEAEIDAVRFESRRNYLIYNSMLLVLSPLLVLFFLHRVCFSGKNWRGLRTQLGDYSRVGVEDKRVSKNEPKGDPDSSVDHPRPRRLWIHAVSVGEVMAANVVVRELRSQFPQATIFLSTTTDTGQKTARKVVERVDHVFYFPFDLPWAVRNALSAVRPDIVLMVETELWPNFLHHAAASNIPVMLVNGRVSDRALKNYRHLRLLWRWMIHNIALFAMRSRTDADRLCHLGCTRSRVCVTGDVKLDQPANYTEPEVVSLIKEALGVRQDEPLLLAGSTHPGEEEMVLDAWWHARMRHGNLRLLLAPRHIERVTEIEKLIHQRGFQSVRKSRISTEGFREDNRMIILLDTMGELFRLYGAADIAFVGGSLIPRGGHNVLEAAMQGKPVLFGPYVDNFRDAARLLETNGIGFPVTGVESLATRITELLDVPDDLTVIRDRAHAVLNENQGAARRIARLVDRLLAERVTESDALATREVMDSGAPRPTMTMAIDAPANIRESAGTVRELTQVA